MQNIKLFSNLVYSTHERSRIDLFLPDRENPPLVFLVHGGGWYGGHRIQYIPSAYELAKRGFAAATVGYPLAPEMLWPDMGYEIYKTAAWLYNKADQFGFDNSRMITWGSSAGAQLTLALHNQAGIWKQQGVVAGDIPAVIGSVAQCAAFDMITFDSDKRRTFMNNADPETVSPAHMDPANYTSIFAVHSKPDDLFPWEDVVAWIDRLSDAGVAAAYHISEEGGHGFMYNILSKHSMEAFDATIPYLERVFGIEAFKERW